MRGEIGWRENTWILNGYNLFAKELEDLIDEGRLRKAKEMKMVTQ